MLDLLKHRANIVDQTLLENLTNRNEFFVENFFGIKNDYISILVALWLLGCLGGVLEASRERFETWVPKWTQVGNKMKPL